jgi:hypothetical protein
MNPATLLTLLALSSPASHDDGRYDEPRERPTQTCDASVVEAFNELDDSLRHLDEMISRMHGPAEKKEHLRQDLVDAVRAAQEARVTSCRAAARSPVVVVQPPAPPPPPAIVVLSDVDQRSLTNAIRREAWDAQRLGGLEIGVRGVCVTSAQARDLSREMTFSSAKLEAVRLLAPRIVDRDKGYLLLKAMTFDSDKRAVREVLSTTPPLSECAPLRG